MTTKPNYHQLRDGTPIPPEGMEGWVSHVNPSPGPKDGDNSHYRTVVSCVPNPEYMFISSNSCAWKYFTPAPKPVLSVPDEFWARAGTACVGLAINFDGVMMFYGRCPTFSGDYWCIEQGGSAAAAVGVPNNGIEVLDDSRPEDSWTPNPYWEGLENE